MTQGDVSLAGRRIAVITSSLDPGSNDLWAAARAQVSALVVVGGRPKADPTLGPDEVALRQVDGGRGLIWRHLVGLRGLLRSFRPDLVHVNGELWGVTAQESLRWGVPVVVHGAENLWDHGGRIERWARDRLVRRSVARIAGYASWNAAGADHVRRVAAVATGRQLPTLVLPAIIPPAPFRTATWAPAALDAASPLEVLLVGRVVAAKGFHTVIEAAGLLTGVPINLTLCGEGPALTELESMASASGVPLMCRGQLTDRELAEVMSRSHVQVQPSLTTPDWAEQFGRTVAEAMTVGLPCLVSGSGELPHVVGDDPRAVFEEGNAGQLADLLRGLVESPECLGDLSGHQRTLARRYDAAEAGRAVRDFWAEALT